MKLSEGGREGGGVTVKERVTYLTDYVMFDFVDDSESC